jgi:hypothetical protein
MKFIFKTISFTVIFLALTGNLAAQEQKPSEKIPTVSYCDLISKPVFYDNKVVRVRATYFAAFETSAMYDLACERKDTSVKFDTWIQQSTAREIWKEFERLTDVTNDDGINYNDRRVEVLWIGLFQGIRPTYKIDGQTFNSGFGHLNSYKFQFTVQNIEEVKEIFE